MRCPFSDAESGSLAPAFVTLQGQVNEVAIAFTFDRDPQELAALEHFHTRSQAGLLCGCPLRGQIIVIQDLSRFARDDSSVSDELDPLLSILRLPDGWNRAFTCEPELIRAGGE
jgi:hypothetical protein